MYLLILRKGEILGIVLGVLIGILVGFFGSNHYMNLLISIVAVIVFWRLAKLVEWIFFKLS